MGTTSTRAWAPADLRHALLLAHPTMSAAAAAAGVSTRTLQRWLSGASSPRPEHALALRRAILPPAEILRRQQQEYDLAAHAAVVMQNRRASAISETWRTRGWTQPHVLEIWENDALRISRPAIRNASAKTRHEAGWQRTQSLEVSNQPAAVLLRARLLEDVEAQRVHVRAQLCRTGASLCYLTPTPQPSLAALNASGPR